MHSLVTASKDRCRYQKLAVNDEEEGTPKGSAFLYIANRHGVRAPFRSVRLKITKSVCV